MESIVDGTWGGGPPPVEYIAFTLMRGMRWSSDQFHATPSYEQRFCYDFLRIIGDHEAEQARKANSGK